MISENFPKAHAFSPRKQPVQIWIKHPPHHWHNPNPRYLQIFLPLLPLLLPPTHTLTHTHKHITLDILLSPWHVVTNLHYFFINHCQLLSQIYHLLCYPWSPLLQNVEISQVKYSFNTSELSHIFKKSFKSIPIPHLQNTLLHKHSGQTHLHCLCTLSSASWHKNLMGNLLSLWFKSVPR